MTFIRHAAAAVALMLAGSAPASAQPATASITGMWLNPHRTVVVRTGACGEKLCGWVVWASAQAQEDARDGGVTRLVGTALLEDYRPGRPGNWSGTVFIPDMGKRFYSEIEQVGADDMKLKGCILHGLICRSQMWHRITDLPHA
ncbi:MAG: DUF2147 domain-containing protein [Sphingomonas taxi]|uniref:DUF2147 domain-containing protein n=1 Tax=Sphingomonas taxi TaxID=1549858 RepID=A0A2W5P8B0_9SPHN|nr:MAG: DUF2147 domain-containing protein [Sphingomonas taxi]